MAQLCELTPLQAHEHRVKPRWSFVRGRKEEMRSIGEAVKLIHGKLYNISVYPIFMRGKYLQLCLASADPPRSTALRTKPTLWTCL